MVAFKGFWLDMSLLPLTVVQVAAVAGVAPQFQLARFVEWATRDLQGQKTGFLNFNQAKTQSRRSLKKCFFGAVTAFGH